MAKKNSGALVPVTLPEICGQLTEIIENIKAAGGECDDLTLAALQAWTGALEAKAQNIALAKARLESEADYFGRIEDAARARRKTHCRSRTARSSWSRWPTCSATASTS